MFPVAFFDPQLWRLFIIFSYIHVVLHIQVDNSLLTLLYVTTLRGFRSNHAWCAIYKILDKDSASDSHMFDLSSYSYQLLHNWTWPCTLHHCCVLNSCGFSVQLRAALRAHTLVRRPISKWQLNGWSEIGK